MMAKYQPWKAYPREQTSVAGRKYMTDVDGTALVDGNFDPPDFDPPMFDVCQKEQTKPRAQPWKAHWSPEEHAVNRGHLQYLCDKDGAALVDGLPGHDGAFSDLCCQKEQTKPRAQPWKAHRSPEEHAVNKGHLQYLCDKDGAALVDGFSNPGHGGGFSDLCCQKEQAKPRAQPWKGHLAAEQQAVDGEKGFHYPSDKDGDALVDGSIIIGPGDGDGGFIDLCC